MHILGGKMSNKAQNKGIGQVVLLLGNYRPTLILARIFSSQGYHIIAGLEGCDGGAQYSNKVDQIWDHPSIKSSPEKFITALTSFVKRNNVSVIFPVSEDFVTFLYDNPQIELGQTRIAAVKKSLVHQCLDKISMMQLAQKLDIPTANFCMSKAGQSLEQIADSLGYPIVIRPEASTKRLNGKKALFVKDKDALSHFANKWPIQTDNLILQKEAKGKRHNIYFAAIDGKIFRYSNAVILRTDNPDGSGLAVEGMTIDPMPALRAHAIKLIHALNYTGIGCVQYLVDDATGDISFLEVNARIAGNHALPEYAGLKLSNILLDLATNTPFDTQYIEGKVGINYVWTCGEIQGAKIAYLGKELTGVKAIGWVIRAIISALITDLHMTFSISDPKPGIMALKDQIPNFRKYFSQTSHNSTTNDIR